MSINLSLCRFPGRLFIFKICYEIRNKWPSCPSFQEGDSGSGVFVIENGQPSNPFGIAFAFQSGGEITVVCKANSILHACKLAICQEEIEMDLKFQGFVFHRYPVSTCIVFHKCEWKHKIIRSNCKITSVSNETNFLFNIFSL